MALARNVSAAVGFSLLIGAGAAAQEPPQHPLEIRVAAEGWGDAHPDDIRKVLESAGNALLGRLPDLKLPPIEVSRSRTGPITLFQRGPGGEIRVRLDVDGRHWAQFSFQFGHEICHVVCGCVDYANPDLWFEESVCETASLYVLGRMAEDWKLRPPYATWKDYAPALQKYRDERLAQGKLPEGTSLEEWYRKKKASLREDPHQRPLNLVAASALLPIFEASPEHWGALPFLNAVRGDGTRSFPRYLGDWSRSAPEKHRAFIATLAMRFGTPADR
ncbi:MAG TPA: hypothetical protein VMU54_20505 [Planctomycetota bacterium]|nr:hypothetical protein [Planctomycetota bacterium]